MKTRKLGTSDLHVSEVGLGCNNFGGRIDLEQTRTVVHKAIDLGINLFDTADVYGGRGKSEEFLGEVLGDRRKEIVLATKFGHTMDDSGQKQGASARYIAEAVEASLKRLKTDVIDLYQLHTPDPKTPMEETLTALSELGKSGKVRYIGCSNLPAWQVTDAHWIAAIKGLPEFVSCQDEYSLLHRYIEPELIPMASQFNLGILPYFPLASGFLTGKYKQGEAAPEGTRLGNSKGLSDRYMTDANWTKVQGLTDFAAKSGHTLLELAFSWLLSKPVISSVIAGATKPEQVELNANASDWTLNEADLKEIDEILSAK